MIFAIVAAICMLVSLGFFRVSGNFTFEEGGRRMLMMSIIFFLAGVFLIGISMGTFIGSIVS